MPLQKPAGLFPWQLQNIIAQGQNNGGGDMLLSALITALQNGLGYVCPQCNNTGQHVTSPNDNTLVGCETCGQMGKTNVQYVAVTKVTGYQPQ